MLHLQPSEGFSHSQSTPSRRWLLTKGPPDLLSASQANPVAQGELYVQSRSHRYRLPNLTHACGWVILCVKCRFF